MAILIAHEQLSLSLEEAAEKQLNGEDTTVVSVVTPYITKSLYNDIFNHLVEMDDLKRLLRKITQKNINDRWNKIHGEEVTYVPKKIYTTPCVMKVTGCGVIVALPFYIPLQEPSKIEKVLKTFISEDLFLCHGNEIHVNVQIPIRYDSIHENL